MKHGPRCEEGIGSKGITNHSVHSKVVFHGVLKPSAMVFYVVPSHKGREHVGDVGAPADGGEAVPPLPESNTGGDCRSEGEPIWKNLLETTSSSWPYY